MKPTIIITLLVTAALGAPSTTVDRALSEELTTKLLASRDSKSDFVMNLELPLILTRNLGLCDGPEDGYTNCVNTLDCSGLWEVVTSTGCFLCELLAPILCDDTI